MNEASHAPQGVCIHCGQHHPEAYSHCPNSGKTLVSGKGLIGKVVADRYRVVGLIGEGGMGSVFLAEHMLIGRRVALKCLHPELASDERAVARFHNEARAAAATGHENVVEVLDLGRCEDGSPFLVMEYLEGRSLAETLRRERRLAPTRACHITGQVLGALSAVHAAGILHRDLKPDNVLLTRRGGNPDYVKVLDFGISKMRRDEGQLDLTRTGVAMGTPYYMSPEQARGIRDVDQRVDLYATGVILYECLTGRLPFDARNYHALLQAILEAEPPKVHELVANIHRGLSMVVDRAIARDPKRRFQTAQEMLAALVPYGAPESSLDSEPPASMTVPPPQGLATTLPLTSAGHESAAPAAPDDALPESQQVLAAMQRLRRPSMPSAAPRAFMAASDDWRGGPSSHPVTAAAEPRREPAEAHPQARTSEPVVGDDTVRARGSVLLSAVEHIERVFGAEALARVLSATSEVSGARLGSVILPVAWFDVRVYQELLEVAERQLGTGSGSVAEDIGTALADHEASATQPLSRRMTPALTVEGLPRLWKLHHHGGSVHVARKPSGTWTAELRAGQETHLQTVALIGYWRRLLTLAGARALMITLVSSPARGDARTVISMRWR